jgi:hypothetical protein
VILKIFIMKPLIALGGGLAGACAVTLIHETVRRVVPEAPRMDRLGMNAISKGLHATFRKVPDDNKLFTLALAGDFVSNALFYSLAGAGKEKNIWVRSAALGLTAGLSAVVLPEPLGLNEKYSNRTVATKIMTVGLYVAGSIVATAVIKFLEKRKKKEKDVWEHRLVTSAMG